MSPYVFLAKLAVESFVKDKKVISSSFAMELLQRTGLSKDLSDKLLSQRAGTFVTIEKEGNLRGCIGTYLPTKENIAEEIISNAIAAATKDYRFRPIQKEELPLLSYTVYLLGEPELVRNLSELNPKKYGILVKTIPVDFSQKQDVVFNGYFPHKSGLLLPDLAGIETPEEQISIACQKAGIDLTKEKIIIYRFTAEKYQ